MSLFSQLFWLLVSLFVFDVVVVGVVVVVNNVELSKCQLKMPMIREE